jgi:hypothetical protein
MPNPKWYIADLVGRPLAGGYLGTFSSLDHDAIKLVYQTNDINNLMPWPYVDILNSSGVPIGKQGILFDENGSQGPFYFLFDTAFPDQLYYLEVYDSDGVLQWTINNFSPANTGGGSVITTAINLNNLVTNNVMWRNQIGDTPIVTAQFMPIAPGGHAGLTKTVTVNDALGVPVNQGPDIVFLKNNLNAVDTINFANFNIDETFPNGEPTPLNYLHYSCTILGAGETQKCVQFPITKDVHNIQNQVVTLSIFARCTAGIQQLTINWLQFFGDGTGGSLPVITPISTLALTAAWQKFPILSPGANVPSLTGKTLGACRNDGLFLQVQYPLSQVSTIDFTLLSLYMGNVLPAVDFKTYDMIDAVINSPRTGYVVQGWNNVAIGGYVVMNDGTIGTAGSGATTRANVDTFPLYNMLYTTVGQTWAPVAGFTGNAIADFEAGRLMTLPRMLGRALATLGGGHVLGENAGGPESFALALNQIPQHTHNSPPGFNFVVEPGSGLDVAGVSPGTPSTITGGITGFAGQQPINILQPTSYLTTFIKL